MEKLKIITTGFIGLYPSGGVTWDYIQYVLGLQQLGHDVYYIEDTGQYAHYRISDRAVDDPFDTVQYLKQTMEGFGLTQKWAYRDSFNGKCYGMSEQQIINLCEESDIFLNVSAANIYRPEYMNIPTKVLIDSDPMFTQVQSLERAFSNKNEIKKNSFIIDDYDSLFTFGENLGVSDCLIPNLNFFWKKTRQPICLDLWRKNGAKSNQNNYGFSTVMNWSTRSKLCYNDSFWGQKDVEFEKLIGVPMKFNSSSFDIVVSVSSEFKRHLNPSHLSDHGWNVISPDVIASYSAYQNFISSSKAEFSVAKETYVKSNSGWFSCRSACYLASGKPVITQETGWSKYIPSGRGALSFIDEATAIEALKEVNTNYDSHSKHARELASCYFDSAKVLTDLIDQL